MARIRAARLSNSLLFPIVLILAGTGLPCVASAQDTAPPEIVEFSFSPTMIDVSTGAQTVTVTARVVDSLSGFTMGQLTFVSPSQAQHQPGFFNASNRISGDANDGIYQFTITFPQFAEAGIWTAAGGCCSGLSDVVGNNRFFDATYLASFMTDLSVIAEPSDTTPPEIVEFSFSPTMIDVSAGAQNVTVTARVVDGLAGFGMGQLMFVSPSQAQHQPGFFNESNRISGTANDGIYQFTITFPQFAEAGIWTAAGACCSGVSDAVGNDRFFGEAYLAARGFPTELQVGEPQVSIADVIISEGNSGLTDAVFTVSLTFPSLDQVTVQFATAAGTANASSDFVATSGTLTFAPGVTQQTVTVQVRGERRFEPDETFFVNLSSPTNAMLSDAQGQGAILNDDRPRP